MEPFLILFLSIASFFLGFIAVSVGGSGLIMTPLMISMGIPPVNAISAKRFSNMGVTIFSLPKFHKEGKVKWGIGIPLILAGVIGSFIAANIIISTEALVLSRVIGVVMVAIIAFMLINRRFGLDERARKMKKRHKVIGFFVYIFVVFISNFVGGSGILTSFALMSFFGLTFLESAGTRKVAGLLGTLTSVSVYILAGVMLFELAIPLFISAALGGIAGTHYAIRKGDEWVRKLFIVVIIALAIKLLFF